MDKHWNGYLDSVCKVNEGSVSLGGRNQNHEDKCE